jgi:hypothetical protein
VSRYLIHCTFPKLQGMSLNHLLPSCWSYIKACAHIHPPAISTPGYPTLAQAVCFGCSSLNHQPSTFATQLLALQSGTPVLPHPNHHVRPCARLSSGGLLRLWIITHHTHQLSRFSLSTDQSSGCVSLECWNHPHLPQNCRSPTQPSVHGTASCGLCSCLTTSLLFLYTAMWSTSADSGMLLDNLAYWHAFKAIEFQAVAASWFCCQW